MSTGVLHIPERYVVTSDSGEQLQITAELFAALADYLGKDKPAGQVTVTFRNGNVAGVEGTRRYK